MRRTVFLVYGVGCYLLFLAIVFPYAIGFLGNFGVPTTLDGAPRVSLSRALLGNALLLALFAAQHSVMARPWFKAWWTRFVPTPIERSTYVLCSNLALLCLFAFWQPTGGVIWEVQGIGRVLLYLLFAVGWGTVLYATFLVNHFDLFGLRQVWLYWNDQPCTPLPFREPSLYRFVRHPLYVGWIMVLWLTPTMTSSHLFFAAATTTYILIAIRFEERDLSHALPGYEEYRQRVPMLIPRWRGTPSPASQLP